MGAADADGVEPARAVAGDPDVLGDPWRRGATRPLLGVLVLMLVAAGAGDTASPVLVVHSPLLLVALNPRARNVLLASLTVGVVPLLAVGLIRRLLALPVLYRLGRIHGDASLAWVDRRLPRTGRWTRRVERWFDRAAAPAVLLVPGAVTAYLAGSTGMHEAVLLVLSALGTMARLAVLLAIGDALAAPLSWLLRFIAEHQWPLLVLSLALTAIHALRYRKHLGRLVAVRVQLPERVPDRPSCDVDPVGEVAAAAVTPVAEDCRQHPLRGGGVPKQTPPPV
jgi:membrane protein DedA with SNARE-associated domain